jgi:phage I-like protein
MIDNKEALYISPAFLLDVEALTVFELESIGLVNKPAIKGLTRLTHKILTETKEEKVMTETTKVEETKPVEEVTLEPVIKSVEEVSQPVDQIAALMGVIDEMKAKIDSLMEKVETSFKPSEVVPAMAIVQQDIQLASTQDELSPEQLKICKQFGLTKEQFIKAKI